MKKDEVISYLQTLGQKISSEILPNTLNPLQYSISRGKLDVIGEIGNWIMQQDPTVPQQNSTD